MDKTLASYLDSIFRHTGCKGYLKHELTNASFVDQTAFEKPVKGDVNFK